MKKEETKLPGNLGGIFDGLGSLFDKLNELSANAEELNDNREFSTELNGKELKGVYGFNFKFGINKDTKQPNIKVEPFGNVKKDAHTKSVRVEEIREPMTDVLEESDHLLILAEMPGISESDVQIEINGDVLELNAENKERKFRKEILLPFACETNPQVKSNNGIIEINCRKV